jgi:hypothetical protein
MRGIIKGLLAEELKNSLKMQKEYEAALRKLPKGCFVRKVIYGRPYYYFAERKGRKVVYKYKGNPSVEELKKAEDVKKDRAKYRRLLSKVKKQVKYLRGAIRGKEPI